MKTQLQKELAKIAPSISIETIWEHDEDAACDWKFLSQPGNCFHGEDSDDWECWQSEVKATAIQDGDKVSGNAYMGGTWEKYGDNPAISNPTISGCEMGHTEDALRDLRELVSITDTNTRNQIDKAIAHIETKMRESYEAQLATA